MASFCNSVQHVTFYVTCTQLTHIMNMNKKAVATTSATPDIWYKGNKDYYYYCTYYGYSLNIATVDYYYYQAPAH
eukprot:16194-Heterococcus_DN1.PRE.2